MLLKFSVSIALLAICSAASALPQHSPWPGGVAVVQVGAESRPMVSVNSKAALILRANNEWIAIIGIPLDQDDTEPLVATILRPGEGTEQIAVDLQAADYRVQRLNVDRKYVEPDPASLERIFAERKIIDSALGNWRSKELTAVILQTPVPGKRSTSFGSRRIFNDQPRSPHKGMDITAITGTPILAPRGGIVTATGDYYFNGNTVILDHGQGFISLYCHLSEIDVVEGQEVMSGNLLGKVGATGRVTGAHLHFATYLNATAVDPALLIVTDR